MKKKLLEVLICPACLPEEVGLVEDVEEEQANDIITGTLTCSRCGRHYPIHDGMAELLPPDGKRSMEDEKYETEKVLSSYLWSHYADFAGDPQASSAYREWAAQLHSHGGYALDMGTAVGRFAFEMAQTHDFVVGVDLSRTFIRTAHQLARSGRTTCYLPMEGRISREMEVILPPSWNRKNVEFLVADAQALPFKSDVFSLMASLNLVDKVPKPLLHLEEGNRVGRQQSAQWLISDPFSWSTEVAAAGDWLGGLEDGEFSGYGLDNIEALLSAADGPSIPAWKIDARDHVWWKIRTHANHYELIRSCYLAASR